MFIMLEIGLWNCLNCTQLEHVRNPAHHLRPRSLSSHGCDSPETARQTPNTLAQRAEQRETKINLKFDSLLRLSH